MKYKVLAGAFVIAFITSSLNMVDLIPVPNYVRGISAALFLICVVVAIAMIVSIGVESSRERKRMMRESLLRGSVEEANPGSQDSLP